MKKLVFVLGILLAGSVFAEDTRPGLEVQLSPGNLPTQRVIPGTESVEILRVWLTAKNHEEANGIALQKLRFLHEGADRDQFLRYTLMQENKSLGKESLADSDSIKFGNLNVWLADGKITELRILTDVSRGDIGGEHTFAIPRPDDLTLKKNDIRDEDTYVTGDFPVRANKIIVGKFTEAPSPECNLREEPVCGADGKSYYNLCIPFQKGIEVLYEGACDQDDFAPLEPCPETFEPICGTDGWTYANSCEFERKEGATKLHDGSCFPKDFVRPNNFSSAVDLFDMKENELSALRPRISEAGQERLARISFVLHQYNFTLPPRLELVSGIGDFLDFTQNLSDRSRMEQEIELLNVAVIDARTASAQEKYERGKIPFVDADEDAWFLGPVLFLKQHGWITGYTDSEGKETGLFHPDQFITRAEITDIALDAAGITKNPALAPANPFAEGHWAHDVIATAEELGLSLWADEPNPDKKVDRGEVLKLIFEVFDVKVPNGSAIPYFSDVYTDSQNFNAIQYAKKKGIVSGYSDGTFHPNEPTIRAEAAKIIKNAYDILR